MRIEFNIYMKVIGAEIGAILGIFQQISSLDNIYRGQRVDWFLTAKSKKKAMEKLIIRDEKLTDKAVYFLKKDLTSHPLVSKTMWSENGTQLIVQNYLGSSIDNFCFSLVLAKEDDIDVRKVMNLLTEMISRFEPKIITLETEDYALKKRYVFPDRLPIGWLMYIGHAYGEGAFDLGDRAIDVNKSGESIGTLFLSKEGLFNGEDEQDIKTANDLETLLAAHNVLPTYDEIF